MPVVLPLLILLFCKSLTHNHSCLFNLISSCVLSCRIWGNIGRRNALRRIIFAFFLNAGIEGSIWRSSADFLSIVVLVLRLCNFLRLSIQLSGETCPWILNVFQDWRIKGLGDIFLFCCLISNSRTWDFLH